MNKPIIFLGPSLPLAAARAIVDADYRPPVRRDDIRVAARERPPLIGIIDGVFMHTLAPSPHEVLRALHSGVPMLGSSSLGALRAVELAPFGMLGIGTVYEWFRTGALDADDEVALVFHPDGLHAVSEPMVNIRFAIAAAERADVLTHTEGTTLMAIAKALYFPDRSYRRLFLEARTEVDPSSLEAFQAFLRRGDYDLKAQDAKQLLREVARRMTQGASS